MLNTALIVIVNLNWIDRYDDINLLLFIILRLFEDNLKNSDKACEFGTKTDNLNYDSRDYSTSQTFGVTTASFVLFYLTSELILNDVEGDVFVRRPFLGLLGRTENGF